MKDAIIGLFLGVSLLGLLMAFIIFGIPAIDEFIRSTQKDD